MDSQGNVSVYGIECRRTVETRVRSELRQRTGSVTERPKPTYMDALQGMLIAFRSINSTPKADKKPNFQVWRGVCICFFTEAYRPNCHETHTANYPYSHPCHAMEPRCSSPPNYRSLPRYAYPVLEVISIALSALFRYANVAWLFQLWLCFDRT